MFEYAERLARWARELRRDSEWTDALNAALDTIGFDEKYISTLPGVRRNYNRIKAIKDHIWGMIEIEPADAWILDCPLFQRMRHVRQTGLTYLTYPNAQHTRFEHSLGVYFVVKRLLATFRRTKESFEIEAGQHGRHESGFKPVDYGRHTRPARLLLHAALLHDAGHAVFSHVSERLFTLNSDRLRIGRRTVAQFVQSFRSEYALVESAIQTGRRKPLAELLTVAIITSERFEKFYSTIPGRVDNDPFLDLCDISALVLGDRIEANDFALPEVLSGPVDADKIDYMIRDAHACGISIGVDVARMFVRAGAYEGPARSVEHLKLEGYNEKQPIRLFVIEQSGTDAVRELGTARLSLYERVYHHQLTRSAQAAFSEMILRAAESRDPRINQFGDFLILWQMPEDVVLTTLARLGEPRVGKAARSILTRRFPKRAGCIGREFLHAPEAPVEVVSNALQDAHELRLHEYSDKVLSRLDGPIGEDLRARVQEECTRIRHLLETDVPIGVRLPEDQAPGTCRLLPYPRPHDQTPPPALIIRTDRIERFGDRYFSYLYAGETSSQIAYLLVSEHWREIALIALQNVLYRHSEPYEVSVESKTNLPVEDETKASVEGETVPDEESVRAPPLVLDALFRPALDAESAARKCKVRVDDFRAIGSALARAGYFDAFPQLRQHGIPQSDMESIADRFSEFAGEQGWKVRPSHVAAFTSQFPPHLREEVVHLLRAPDRLLFLNREATTKLVVDALSMIRLSRPLRLVPLTASSGQYIRTHIRNAVAPATVSVHANLSHALSVLKAAGGSIVFIDDNIASGTQASRQLAIYMGIPAEKLQGNYIIEPLDEEERGLLQTHGFGAAFSIGHRDGKDRLIKNAKEHGITIPEEAVVWGKPIDESSGKKPDASTGRTMVSEDLRAFLSSIGFSVLRRRYEREGHADPSTPAREFALGYGGLEGLVVTPFSVPTSTYPAFWCPGFREVKLHDGIIELTPWVPLFLRTNMLQHLVLG